LLTGPAFVGNVEVVDAQNQPATRLSSEQPVEERRSGSAGMQRPRRRGGEA